MTYNMLNIGDKFCDLLSLGEAAEIWGKEESTIRKAIAQGRLVDGQDCRKFGKQWVVTVEGMAKAFPTGLGTKNLAPWSDHMSKLRYQERLTRENS